MLADVLDRLLYRHPFEGRSAARYSRAERPAFGDLDDRLLERMAFTSGCRVLDLGCGPGTFARRAISRVPGATLVAIDPSRDFASSTALAGGTPNVIRAAAEALPLADGSVDVAVCLSSLRHFTDRARALGELRRVVRERAWIVELDPTASRARIAAHANALAGSILRRAFGPLVVRTAPRVETIEALARAAGFAHIARSDDPVQPVYILELA